VNMPYPPLWGHLSARYFGGHKLGNSADRAVESFDIFYRWSVETVESIHTANSAGCGRDGKDSSANIKV